MGVTERGAERESTGCGVEHGVLVGVGVDGFGVPDPKTAKYGERKKNAYKGRLSAGDTVLLGRIKNIPLPSDSGTQFDDNMAQIRANPDDFIRNT